MMRKGLFGKGMGFGGGIVATPEQEEETRRLEAMFPNAGDMPASLPDMAQIPTTAGGAFGDPMASQPQRKPGLGTRLLGQGWEGKVAALGASLMGDRSAVPDYFQSREVMAFKQAEAQRARAAELADFERKQQIEAQYRAPKVNDTIADFEWFKNLSAADRALYEQMRPVYRQGADGQFYRVDTNQQQSGGLDALPEGYSVRQGGTGGNVGGNFR
jgi:hypothetical protein